MPPPKECTPVPGKLPQEKSLKIWDQIIEVEGEIIQQGNLDFISETMRAKKSGEKLTSRVTRKDDDGNSITKEIILVAP